MIIVLNKAIQNMILAKMKITCIQTNFRNLKFATSNMQSHEQGCSPRAIE